MSDRLSGQVAWNNGAASGIDQRRPAGTHARARRQSRARLDVVVRGVRGRIVVVGVGRSHRVISLGEDAIALEVRLAVARIDPHPLHLADRAHALMAGQDHLGHHAYPSYPFFHPCRITIRPTELIPLFSRVHANKRKNGSRSRGNTLNLIHWAAIHTEIMTSTVPGRTHSSLERQSPYRRQTVNNATPRNVSRHAVTANAAGIHASPCWETPSHVGSPTHRKPE